MFTSKDDGHWHMEMKKTMPTEIHILQKMTKTLALQPLVLMKKTPACLNFSKLSKKETELFRRYTKNSM